MVSRTATHAYKDTSAEMHGQAQRYLYAVCDTHRVSERAGHSGARREAPEAVGVGSPSAQRHVEAARCNGHVRPEGAGGLLRFAPLDVSKEAISTTKAPSFSFPGKIVFVGRAASHGVATYAAGADSLLLVSITEGVVRTTRTL